MSTPSEADFDLEKLFLPAWAQESPDVNRYAKYAGDDRPVDRDRKFDDRRRPPRRDGGGRPSGPGGPNRGPRGDRSAGPRREGGRPPGGGENRPPRAGGDR